MRNDAQDELHATGQLNAPSQTQQWRVASASVRGTSHERVGQLCQDAHHWEKLPTGVLVAAVADGAGSATLGKVGAIVAAQTAVETLCAEGSRLHLIDDDREWQQILTQALTAAKAAVEAEASVCNRQARELATTLILAVATPELVAAVQVGDGLAVASDRDGQIFALTASQKGEYINETTFLVSPQALESVQVNVWRGTTTNIAVFSDGLQMLAVNMGDGSPYKPFFSPLFQFMAGVEDEHEAKEQLAAFLRSPRITERTDDDLTLLLATLVS